MLSSRVFDDPRDRRPGTRPSSASETLVAHQDADLVDLLPLVLEGQEGADLEVAGGDIHPLGKLAPVVEVARATFQSSSLLSTMNSSLPVMLVRFGMVVPSPVAGVYRESGGRLMRRGASRARSQKMFIRLPGIS